MPEASDHVLAIAKAAIAAIPVVGGSIASLIGDYVPTAHQRSVDAALAMLAQQTAALADRIDADAIDREDFAEIFKSAYLEIARTHKDIKRRAAVGLIVNAMIAPGDQAKLQFSELDHFARSLAALSSGALDVLCVAVRLARQAPGQQRSRRLVFHELDDACPAMGCDLVMGLVAELNAVNLVHLAPTGAIRTDNYGNYPVEVTDLGFRFVEYVLQLVP